jgi:L-lactate dehydrogenase complex protein LldG
MSSKEKILTVIKNNKPDFSPIEDWIEPDFNIRQSVVEYFESVLTSIHTTVKHIASKEALLNEAYNFKREYTYVIDTLHVTDEERINIEQLNAQTTEALDVAIIEGMLGVAENGAIWLTEDKMLNRLLPFICKHLVLVINADKIVLTMHDAYKKITINETGYGVFISGPSKTADIEQSLVIGAHGPLTLTVYIITNKA